MKKLFLIFGALLLPFVVLLSAVLMMMFTVIGQEKPNNDGGGYSGTPPVSGEALKVATKIYEHEVKVHKATKQGASGSVAVAQRESEFDPQAINTGGGVAGIFQWSGFVNNVNGNRITSEGSIKAGDKSTLTLENQLKLLDYELNGVYKKAKEMLQKATDPAQSALDWSKIYEGVSLDDPQTKPEAIKDLARQWYSYFSGGSTSGKIDALEKLVGQKVGSGQCYALSNYYVNSISGFNLVGMNASDIGSDNEASFKKNGWTVIFIPKARDLVAGAVINWGAGPIAGSLAQNPYGHTGVINAVKGDKFSTYEQNVGGEFVQKFDRTWDSSITSICIPLEKIKYSLNTNSEEKGK